MKAFFDFLPVLVFFVTYIYTEYNIYYATAGTMIACALLIAGIFILGKRPSRMQWIVVSSIMLLGGLTLILHNPLFIMWKPTIVYIAMGAALLISRYIIKRDALKLMMGEQITLPDAIWLKLTWMWVGFFIFMATLNLYVAYSFEEDIWVKFKMFGGIGLMIFFVILQSIYLMRHLPKEEESKDSADKINDKTSDETI